MVAIAVGLRAWKLGWGLDAPVWFPDEMLWLKKAFRFVPLSWAAFDADTLVYPTLYGYLSGLATCAAAGAGWLEPGLGRAMNPALLRAVRGTSVAAGVVTVLATGAIGRRLYGPAVGLGAAAFLAVTPLEALQTHYASVDVLLGTWTALALLGAWRLGQAGTAASALVAGVPVGLAFATKYSGIAVATAVAWAAVERAWTERSIVRLVTLGLFAAAGAAGAAALACPPCVLRGDLLQQAFVYHRFHTAMAGFANNHLEPSLGWAGLPYVYQAVASLPWSLGWPLWLVAAAGVGVAAWRHEAGDRLLLAAAIPYAFVVGGSRVTFPRYLMPLFPMLAVLAARTAVGRTPGRARVALAAAVVAYTLALAASQVDRFSWDQQQAVGDWLGRHLPPRAVVVVPKFLDYFRVRGFIRNAGMSLEDRIDGHWRDGAPDAIVVPEWYAIALRRDWSGASGDAELTALESGTAGWTEATRWPIPPYLHMGLYTARDPALAVDLWQGVIGFRIYLRRDRAEAVRLRARLSGGT